VVARARAGRWRGSGVDEYYADPAGPVGVRMVGFAQGPPIDGRITGSDSGGDRASRVLIEQLCKQKVGAGADLPRFNPVNQDV
jgi:hypothetical protein